MVGLREKLKGILLVVLIVLGISAVIKWISAASQSVPVMETAESLAADAAPALAQEMVKTAAPIIPAVQSLPDIALWFLMGSIAALLIYLVVELIREKIKNKAYFLLNPVL